MGVISGPDGPTAVFVTGSPFPLFVLLALAAALAGAAVWLLRRRR